MRLRQNARAKPRNTTSDTTPALIHWPGPWSGPSNTSTPRPSTPSTRAAAPKRAAPTAGSTWGEGGPDSSGGKAGKRIDATSPHGCDKRGPVRGSTTRSARGLAVQEEVTGSTGRRVPAERGKSCHQLAGPVQHLPDAERTPVGQASDDRPVVRTSMLGVEPGRDGAREDVDEEDAAVRCQRPGDQSPEVGEALDRHVREP